jgi:hypothetical protein
MYGHLTSFNFVLSYIFWLVVVLVELLSRDIPSGFFQVQTCYAFCSMNNTRLCIS